VRAIKVGDTARRSMLMTDEQVDLFARLSGDRNPLHSTRTSRARRGLAAGSCAEA
jgi:acyl dehydratase